MHVCVRACVYVCVCAELGMLRDVSGATLIH